MEKLIERMEACGGKVSLYYRPLYGGEAVAHNADMPLIAASIIKIPVMIEAFRRFESGEMDRNAIHVLREDEKKPSCGALNRMHAGLEVTMRDLVDLMIVLSDNTATNILIDYLGVDAVNQGASKWPTRPARTTALPMTPPSFLPKSPSYCVCFPTKRMCRSSNA